jgi:hypothetical protein
MNLFDEMEITYFILDSLIAYPEKPPERKFRNLQLIGLFGIVQAVV